MKKELSIILFLTLILACQKSEYKTVDFKAFKMTVPTTWNKYNIKGIDSYVSGLITDNNDTLIFDLGWYSGDLTKNNEVLVFDRSEYSEFTEEKNSN